MDSSLLHSPIPPPSLGLHDHQSQRRCKSAPMTEIFLNCIKLARDNKINQKNAWDLPLIDHISEIIKVEAEDDVKTDFQKASSTLEAGVKIYASRVDSAHSEAYKLLGGINLQIGENEQEAILDDDHTMSEHEGGHSKKVSERKMSPLSTLESSFEALNIKKFDDVFTVDPLYHQTSAQFDEGGAKGLLLNNLGVYCGCRIIFDSFEVFGNTVFCDKQSDKSDTIDVSFAKGYIEQMVINLHAKDEISPTLRRIINQFDENNQRPSSTFSVGQKESGQDDAADHNLAEPDSDAFVNYGNSSLVDENSDYTEPDFPSYQEENDSYADELEIADSSENIVKFLLLGLRFTSNRNDGEGPNHWKLRKVRGSKDNPDGRLANKTGKQQERKQAKLDLSFTDCLDSKMPNIFAPPQNQKSLLLPSYKVPCKTTLSEDCAYQPEDLVKFFLLPNTLCLKKRARKSADESRGTDFEPLPSWDSTSALNNLFDDGNVNRDVKDSKLRQVNKIQYDTTPKEVEFHALKGTLWKHIQDSFNMPEMGNEAAVSFRYVLARFSDDFQVASQNGISPRLCFIILLHLANEHKLSLRGCPSLDDVHIDIPHHTRNLE